MKKVIWSVLGILVIVVGVALGFQFKINKLIEAKINELNSNGFVVKHEQSSNYLKTNAKGEVEVIYPDKVIPYLLSNMKNEENKKAIEKQYSLLDLNEKEMFFEGIKFEYDFLIDNLTTEANANIYLTNLSKKVMYNLEQEKDEEQASRWLLDFLKEKKIKVSIDKDLNYKLADIDTVIPNAVFITLRGLEGNSKNFKLPLFKISDADASKKEYLQLNNINIDYESNANKESSKSVIETIEFQDLENKINVRNLVVNSSYEKDEININAKSEFSFDEVYIKNYGELTTSLKKSSVSFTISKLPIKKLEEIKEYLENQKYDEYLKSVAQSGTLIESAGSASSYEIKNQKILDTLKYSLYLQLNKDVSVENAKSVKDVFEKIKLTVDLDETTALNAKTLLALQSGNEQIDFVDTNNNLKRFEAELKPDGVYVNNKKVLDEKELLFPKEEFYEEQPTENQSSKGIFYEYKFLDNNQIQVDFKYGANMKSISSGGISVSFPQFMDESKVIKHTTNSFDKINFYNKDTEIWNGALQKNVKASYLLVEGWDENWTDSSIDKEFSLVLDVKDLDVLKINFRAGALNDMDEQEIPYETVPETGDLDQQEYPVQTIEIPLKK